MIKNPRDHAHHFNPAFWLICVTVLLLAFLLGQQASVRWLGLLVAGLTGLALLGQPVIGLLLLVMTALVLPLEFSTGTEVRLNPAALLVPALILVWLLDMVRRQELRLVFSRTSRPLAFFLLAGLLSLLIGRATWDPIVPVQGNFLLVQLAQWGIFAFSAGAFWLTANLVSNELWLRRLTFAFLLLGGVLAIASILPGIQAGAGQLATQALVRAPFWMLLAALSGGQLLFNQRLSTGWLVFLAMSWVAILYSAFFLFRESSSTWVGVGAVSGMLIWLRWPRLRWLIIFAIVAMVLAGFLFPTVYEFAGGDEAWFNTGGSRLTLINRVIEVTLRNPITGLGPAAYRPYANSTPLIYAHIVWAAPRISSHNNYVDLFAHVGLLGISLFAWFAVEVARLGLRLRRHLSEGFAAGYVNGMLAAGVGALMLMLFADWILPFVYNIGFPGFQASVLVWLFLGGLVSLDNMGPDTAEAHASS